MERRGKAKSMLGAPKQRKRSHGNSNMVQLIRFISSSCGRGKTGTEKSTEGRGRAIRKLTCEGKCQEGRGRL